MAIIGKQLPAFKLEAFRKPELIQVTNEDIKGKMECICVLSSRLHICLPNRTG